MNIHRHNRNSTEVSSYNCAVCSGPDHDDVAMVGCDNCSQWFHFKCVGVSADVKEVSWSCINCKEKAAHQSYGRTAEDSGQKEPAAAQTKASEADVKDVSVEVDELEKELQRLEETRKLELRKMELEKTVFRRRLEVQRELAEQRQKVEREKRQMELELEKEHLQKAIADEEAYRKAQQAMRNEMQSKLEQLRIQRTSDNVQAICGPERSKIAGSNAANGQPKIYCETYQKHSTPKGTGIIPEMSGTRNESPPIRLNEENTTSESEGDDVSETTQVSVYKGPTKAQLSARQFLARKLPVFSGHPEDWPMFISSYETANEACGFSNVENLARLQESLKGQALEAVRSRLLLPNAVPQIIETLRMLYGRPEQLLNMLLAKVRKADPPKADRLASFIGYGMVVQQLVDHLDATNMRDHLFNPMLIQELVEKLPAGTKMEWVRYKRKVSAVTLRTLADFLSEIVRDASEATMFAEGASVPDNRSKKGKVREGYLNAHRMSPDEEEEQRNSMNSKKPCRVCNRVDHRIRNCDQFRKLSWENRWEVVYKWKLCKNCLNEHGDSRCKLNYRCNVERCGEAHHPLLHPEEALSDCNVHGVQHHSVIFRLIPVTIYNGKIAVNTVAFIDEGSSYTLVETSLVNQLNLKGRTQPLRVTWTAGVSRVEKDSQIVDLSILSLIHI